MLIIQEGVLRKLVKVLVKGFLYDLSVNYYVRCKEKKIMYEFSLAK